MASTAAIYKALTTSLICLFVSISTWAEDSGQPLRLASRLAQTDFLEGEFEQRRHVAVLALPLDSSGTFRYRRDSGILWRTSEPVESEVRISAGAGVVVMDEKGASRPVPATELVASIFVGIFSGDLERLGEYFTLTEEHRDNGWSLRLTPRQKTMARHMDNILLTGADHIERVVIQESNGDRTELVLRVTADGEAAR